MADTPMNAEAARVWLYVPFEERERVRALGARWDATAKCWFLEPGENPAPFRRWIDAEDAEEEYTIVATQAMVVSTTTPCWRCGTPTEVCCLYCEQGTVDGEPRTNFVVSEVTAIDEALRQQLTAWPQYRFAYTRASGRCLTNHCTHCTARQADYFLHCEPGGAFFRIRGAEPGRLRTTQLRGSVRLDGDEGFEPD